MRATVSVTNRTKYDTAFLRTLFRKLFAASRREERHPYGRVRVTCVSARQTRSTSGHAVIGGTRMQLNLEPDGSAIMLRVAAVFLHELDHLRGYGHDKMPDRSFYVARAAKYLAMTLPEDAAEAVRMWGQWGPQVPQEPPRVALAATRPPRASLLERRLMHAARQLKRADSDQINHERLAKAAHRRVVAWRKKVSYYEQRIASTTTPTVPGKE